MVLTSILPERHDSPPLPCKGMSPHADACCKVGATAETYDLSETLDGETDRHGTLIDRWTGADGTQPLGYRPLTDWFNTLVMRTAYRANGVEPTAERIERDYAALMGDDTLREEATKDRLESEGVDPVRLSEALISWSTMSRHLTDCLDADKETPEATTEWEQNSVEYAKDILHDKLDEALRSLTAKERIVDGEEAAIIVDIQLQCMQCPRKAPFHTVLDRGYVCPEHRHETD